MVRNNYNKIFCKFVVACSLLLPINGHAQVKILFDATKGEMAGNGDWVIDYDASTLGVGSSGTYLTSSGHQSNPQRIPTPAQSGITASTAETYWSGALSSWAVDCAKKGYTVETLPWNAEISYGNSSNAQDLSNYKVYIVDEPQEQFTTAQKTAIMQFVQNGGRLFMISDHNGSDRNGDGWDSPAIWNDFLTTNSVQPNPFGIAFDLADFSQTSTNISATSTDSIIHGPMGSVTEVLWSSGTSMTLNTTQNPTVKGVIFKTGTTPGLTNAMVAYAHYGNGGKVAAIGDSSPPDDGTGNPTCTLYNGYWSDASGNHRLLLMNITIWLATTTIPTETDNIIEQNEFVEVYPNPATTTVNLLAKQYMSHMTYDVVDVTGKAVTHGAFAEMNSGDTYSISLNKGFYIIKVHSDQISYNARVLVN